MGENLDKSATGSDSENDTDVNSKPSRGQEMTYLITIGIDRYKAETGSPDNPLHNSHQRIYPDFKNNNCRTDCEELIKCLESNYINIQLEASLIDEQATLDNINTALLNFRRDTSNKNKIDNNLIIYFSGHGDILSDNTGCLIPYGMKEFDPLFVLSLDNLYSSLKYFHTKNTLLIIDSCKSGQIFNQNRPYGNNTAKAPDERSVRSCHALVSSLSDENSKAGTKNSPSAFTGKLIEKLQNNTKAEFSFAVQIPGITGLSHTPSYERLYVEGHNFNTGQFSLKSINGEKRAKEILRTGILSLNFEDQHNDFEKFDTDKKKQLVIFRGTPDSGLSFISKQAKDSSYLPQNPDSYTYKLSNEGASAEEDINNLFKHNFALNKTDKTGLTEEMSQKLGQRSYLLEIHCHDEGAILPTYKTEFVHELINFVELIADTPNGNHLIIFLIDQEDFDYQEHCQLPQNSSINIIPVPPVKEICKQTASKWYNRLKSTYSNEDKTEFTSLFEIKVFQQLIRPLEPPGLPPAVAIRKICKTMACEELANQLLNN
jgi:hypothetical protein